MGSHVLKAFFIYIEAVKADKIRRKSYEKTIVIGNIVILHAVDNGADGRIAASNGVKTEAELRTAIETADGTVDNPTVIELLSNIVLKSKLVIDENANISIEGNNHIISRSETNWKEADKNIFEVKGNLHTANCTLDAKKAYM